MKNFLFYPSSFLLLMSLLSSCESKIKDSTATEGEHPTIFTNQNEHWKHSFNSDIDNISELYTVDALKIERNGTVHNGQSEIVQSFNVFKKTTGKLQSISIIKNVVANSAKEYDYEIGKFTTSDEKEYKHLLIWNNQDSIKKRELEVIALISTTHNLNEEIKIYRNKWIEICNRNNAQQLVEELYAENAVYYNHKPAIIGRTAITAEYSYMNDENYTLSLEPIIVETVQDDLVFEIGQCSGSYLGKYVLVWKKNTAGIWEVLIDSNI